MNAASRLFGIRGYSGSGKTTLITRLLPLFHARGLRVAVIKHTHHDVDLDPPHAQFPKDSQQFRLAGAAPVVLMSSARLTVLLETPGQEAPQRPDLALALAMIAPTQPDWVLVEGFKSGVALEFPALEVWRPALGHAPLWPSDTRIVALASDVPQDGPLPCLNLNQTQTIGEFMLAYFSQTPANGPCACH